MDTEKLSQAKALIKEILQEQFPRSDFRLGSVNDTLLLGTAAAGYAIANDEIENFAKTNTIQGISENPDLADDSMVDAIMSNWGITRRTGSKAKGLVKLVLSTEREYFVYSGTEFLTTNGLIFLTTEDYNSSDIGLHEDSVTGYFYMLIPVEAELYGIDYRLEAGTALETNAFAASLIEVTAFNDFTHGEDNETTTNLISRWKESVSTRDLVSRHSLSAVLPEEFTYIKHLTAIGYNDREMQRNLNSLGMKIAGPVDIYLRTDNTANTKVINVTTDSSGSFFLSYPTNCPILRVRDIALINKPNYKQYEFTHIISSTNPDIEAKFARFSIYESLEISTNYPNTQLLATIDYLPGVAEVQAYVLSNDRQCLCTSPLVKTYMPCFISFAAKYSVSDYSNVPEEQTLKNSLCEYINTLRDDTLYVSNIIKTFLSENVKHVELCMEVSGKYYLPDGSITEVKSQNEITIDSDFYLGYSNTTFQFFCIPSDITVELIS